MILISSKSFYLLFLFQGFGDYSKRVRNATSKAISLSQFTPTTKRESQPKARLGPGRAERRGADAYLGRGRTEDALLQAPLSAVLGTGQGLAQGSCGLN